MKQRTYELMGKYIAEKTNARLVWEKGGTCPSASITDGTIHLPVTVEKDGQYPALALLIHEGMHLKETTKIPTQDLAKDELEHHILNAVEDSRIDNMAFDLLPNVRAFYRKLYEKMEYSTDNMLMARVLSREIMRAECFAQMLPLDHEAQKFARDTDVTLHFQDCAWYLRMNDWVKARKAIEELAKIFKQTLPPEELQKMTMPQQEGEIDIKVKGASHKECMKIDGKLWGKDEGKEVDSNPINPVLLQDATKARFKDLLNIKMTKTIDDGVALNLDSLTSFFTGDLEELFIDDKVIKQKKSKIVFLLDSSGSMSSKMVDGNSRRMNLVNTCSSLVSILDELQQTEGLNIDYDIAMFDRHCEFLNKEDWKQRYVRRSGGSTYFREAFDAVQKRLLKEYDIEGKKIIIAFTDGEVHPTEIDSIKRSILHHSSDIRCMLIGIDSDEQGAFVQEVVGEHNIMCKDEADCVVMETVMDCLE